MRSPSLLVAVIVLAFTMPVVQADAATSGLIVARGVLLGLGIGPCSGGGATAITPIMVHHPVQIAMIVEPANGAGSLVIQPGGVQSLVVGNCAPSGAREVWQPGSCSMDATSRNVTCPGATLGSDGLLVYGRFSVHLSRTDAPPI